MCRHANLQQQTLREGKAPEPSSPRGLEGRWRQADPTKTSPNAFLVNKPTTTFSLQIPLCPTIGLAGSSSASKSLCVPPSVWQAPLQPPNPFVSHHLSGRLLFSLQTPLCPTISLAGSPLSSPSHVPMAPLRPLTAGHHSVHPTVAKAPCPLASFHSHLTSATTDESTSSPMVSPLSLARFSLFLTCAGNHLWARDTH